MQVCELLLHVSPVCTLQFAVEPDAGVSDAWLSHAGVSCAF